MVRSGNRPLDAARSPRLAGGLNLYAYCDGNPGNLIDLWGLQEFPGDPTMWYAVWSEIQEEKVHEPSPGPSWVDVGLRTIGASLEAGGTLLVGHGLALGASIGGWQGAIVAVVTAAEGGLMYLTGGLITSAAEALYPKKGPGWAPPGSKGRGARGAEKQKSTGAPPQRDQQKDMTARQRPNPAPLGPSPLTCQTSTSMAAENETLDSMGVSSGL
jgi:hypothetical protein